MNYGDWLREQTPERAEASLGQLELCRELGRAERRSPNSEETKDLRAKIKKYYEEYP